MVFVIWYKIFLPPKTHFEIFWPPFWIFYLPFWFFFVDSWSTYKAVETKWSLFFNINFFGGHFEFLVADSWSTHKAVETKWSLFFYMKFFYPLELILNFLGGFLKKKLAAIWNFFSRISGLLIKLWKQSGLHFFI